MGQFNYSLDIQHQFQKDNTRRKPDVLFLAESCFQSSYIMKPKAVGSPSNKTFLQYAHNLPIQY